jgi:acetylornithine deacetylase
MAERAEHQIVKAVEGRRLEIAEFLGKLIRIESVTGQEGEIQEFIGAALVGMGIGVDRFEPDPATLSKYPGFVEPELPVSGRPNLVGVLRGSGGGKSLLMNGHVDTVPLGPIDSWTDSPLSGTIRNGMVWGRGASDMKAGLAAMTMAIDVLRSLGLERKGDVILEYVIDEERTGLGTLACVDRGYRADAGICCETSDLQVMPACIGRMWFTIRVMGKPTGISARQQGVSAIEKAIKIIRAIEDLERIRIDTLHHPLYLDNAGALPCAVTMFQSGTYPSITPEKAVLRGSLGLMPYEDPTTVEADLKRQVELVSMADPWLKDHLPDVTTKNGYVAAGAEIPIGHPIVQTVQRTLEAVTGHPPVLAGRMGAADTRHLIHIGATPSVIFGPGLTAQMHAMNEHVPIDNLVAATSVLALTIQDWCNRD